MDYAALKSAVLGRLNMSTDDPAASTVGSLVNEAVQMVSAAAPESWPHLRRSVNWSTVASTAVYPFATVMGAVSSSSVVARVFSVKATIDTSYQSLEILSPDEADDTYNLTSQTGAPEAYWVEGRAVTLYPTPDAEYGMTARVAIDEPELVQETDTPLLPVAYHPAIIAGALTLYYEQLQDTGRSQAAAQRFDGWISRMRTAARDRIGLPRVRVRSW